MHPTRALAVAVLIAVAHARFGQENAVQAVIAAIGGTNGQAATLAGASIGTLLAGANACAKLALADKVAALTGAGAVDAAKALVRAEKNFNPFVVTVPSFCSDAALPATAALRGILPLVDPAVAGAAAANSASAASLANPVDADGLSVADIVAADGAVNFTPQSSAGVVGAEVVAGNGAAAPAAPVASAVSSAIPAACAIASAPAASAPVASAPAASATAVPAPAANTPTNLQTFTGALGAAAIPIAPSGDAKRPFLVNGATFVNFAAAAARTCDVQFNACANAANSGKGVVFADCNAQKTACGAAQAAAPATSFGRRVKRRERAEESRRLALVRAAL